MPETVVELFENPGRVDDAVREIEALGFPRQDAPTITEPAESGVTGVMSFARPDFEVDLSRELSRIGATLPETKAYVEGLRRGRALAFATGSSKQVDAAGAIMNRLGAMEVEEVTGSDQQLPHVVHDNITSERRAQSWPGEFPSPVAAPVSSSGRWVRRSR